LDFRWMILLGLLEEQLLGRVRAGADADALARMLIGSPHLLFADRMGEPPGPDAVRALVEEVLDGVLC
jgi:hypothetical protein